MVRRFILFLIFCGAVTFLFAESAIELYKEGKVAYLNEEYEKAIYFFNRALDQNKNYIEPLVDLANLYYETGNYTYAHRYIKRARELSPESEELKIFEADIETMLQDYESAEVKYKEIIAEDPLNIRAFNGLAKLYLETGRSILAKETLKDILKAQPNNFEALLLLAKIY